MEFTLTYAGKLLAQTTDEKRLPNRSLHVHEIRKEFHKQLKILWSVHPNLQRPEHYPDEMFRGKIQRVEREGFCWLPLATNGNGLVCKLEILLLRHGNPGRVLFDIDNRLKTLFDALRMPKGPDELGENTALGKQCPTPDEVPFYVLLEDDNLITHVAVASDWLLEPVPDTPADNAVRAIIKVTVRPYHVHMDNSDFA